MFGGINHSLSILVSSSLYENSFTAQRIKQVQNNPHSYIIDARVWEVKPKGTYSDVMFPVFLGNDQIDPFIVNTAAELNTVLNTLGFKSVQIEDKDIVETIQTYDETVRQYFILVPEDFRNSFETDIIHAIQDIAGKPVAPLGRLFSSKKHYNEAVRKYNESDDNVYPFTKEQVVISTGAETCLQDFLKKDWVPKHTDRKRYLHIDQSLSGDSTGVACCYLEDVVMKDGETLMCPRIEWMIRINPPKPPAKISIARVRSIIPYLSEKFGIEWGMISYDTYQSAEAIQHLEEDGYNCKQRSVDRTDEAYLTLVDLYYEGRISHPQCNWYEKELFQLIHFRDKRKVDHPPVEQGGTKDIADGVAGCIMNLLEDKDALDFLRERDIDYFIDGVETPSDKGNQTVEDLLDIV